MNLIEIVLGIPKLRNILADNKDVQNTSNLYRDIINYERKPDHLGYAHIIYQKYLDELSPYRVDMPHKYCERIRNVLWIDPDAGDSEHFVVPSIFNIIKKRCHNDLYIKLNQLFDNPLQKEIMIKKIIKKNKNKNKRKSKFILKRTAKLDLLNVKNWTSDQVGLWLDDIGYLYLESLFIDNSIDGQVLLELTDDDMFNLCIPYDDIVDLMKKILVLQKNNIYIN